jgi:putative endonuclease
MKIMYVYIATNRSGTLYIGVTNNLERRITEHKSRTIPGFCAKYKISKLIYYETTYSPLAAIEREKQLKGWLRSKKIALINSINPAWQDLAEGW